LIEQGFLERIIHLKCEFQNPTGSFKDRGTFVLVASLASAVQEAVEDSSGNAGASFAAYARRGGIKATIFVPAYASGPKRDQIAAYGANLIPVEGPRIEASKAVQRRAEAGAVYASHAHQPHVLSGMGTLAYELYESLGQAPGAVVLPLGQGTLLLGIERGFRTLMQDGSIEKIPKLIGVQASVCSPFQDLFERGEIGEADAYTGHTVAEGVRIARPLRAEAVAQAIRKSGGTVLVVEEEQIKEGRDAFASRGFYLEPTAAIVWGALLQGLEGWPDPVVAILTGSGLKTGR
jgi:threonine synthase